MSRKIYVIGSGKGYASWMEGTLVDSMEECDLVVLTGGEDVNPAVYNEKPHPATYYSSRDINEIKEYHKAVKLNKKVIGICRGLQLITALNGGKLIQHQNNPGTHPMKTFDGNEIMITSAHHQAAYPFLLPKKNYYILGWTKDMLHFHEDGDRNEMNPPVEVEMIYFPKTNSFGIQGHPEWMNVNSLTIFYLRNLLDHFMNGTLISLIKTEEKKAKNLLTI